jgi:hypothetical protein
MLGHARVHPALHRGRGRHGVRTARLDLPYIDGARAQGGIAGFVHPYLAAPRLPQQAANTLIAMNLALGRGDYYDVAALWSDELFSAEFYYRLLNAGFRIAATGGTDNFSDVWRDPPAGGRTYARLAGPLTVPELARRGAARPHLRHDRPAALLDVEGHGPGSEIALTAPRRRTLRVRRGGGPSRRWTLCRSSSTAASPAVAVRQAPSASRSTRAVAVPEGGWVAARVLGPASPYTWATTTHSRRRARVRRAWRPHLAVRRRHGVPCGDGGGDLGAGRERRVALGRRSGPVPRGGGLGARGVRRMGCRVRGGACRGPGGELVDPT